MEDKISYRFEDHKRKPSANCNPGGSLDHDNGSEINILKYSDYRKWSRQDVKQYLGRVAQGLKYCGRELNEFLQIG